MPKQQPKKKKKQVKQKPPARWLLGLAFLFVYPYFRLRYRMTIDKSGMADLKKGEPSVILAPHLSNNDHLLVGMAVWPHLPTFVLSEHFMRNPFLRWLFNHFVHPISKKMFCADPHTIMAILRAKQAGHNVIIFPEGRLPACGHTVPVTPGTAELVKKLGVNVYVVTQSGAYKTFPKWATYRRRGKIHITTAKLFDGASLKTMPLDEVRARIDAAILHVDEEVMPDVRYTCRDMTAGLDGILRRCPNCTKIGTLRTQRGHVTCACGLDATLDDNYRLHNAPFDRIYQWYDWQLSQVDPMTEAMETEVIVGAVNAKGNVDRAAGQGRLRMDRDWITFAGEIFGEGVVLRTPTKQVGGLPVTVAEHFDVYFANEMYHFFPTEDPRSVMDWVIWMERYWQLQETAETNAQ